MLNASYACNALTGVIEENTHTHTHTHTHIHTHKTPSFASTLKGTDSSTCSATDGNDTWLCISALFLLVTDLKQQRMNISARLLWFITIIHEDFKRGVESYTLRDWFSLVVIIIIH
jgi:hypothetical protein